MKKILKSTISIMWLPLLVSACAVSSEAINKQFQHQLPDIVFDNKTKLMWAAYDNRTNLTWHEGVEFCQQYQGGGYQDWRMPTSSELATLYENGIRKEGTIFNLTGDRIWAAETDDTKGAFCNLARGGCGWGEKLMSITMRALPVRNSENHQIAASPNREETRNTSRDQDLLLLEALYNQKLLSHEEYQRKRNLILR